jgi:excisionase family DNA binding protein
MPEPDQLITIREAAAILKVHRSQVNRLLTDGRLQYVTLPPGYRRVGRWRYMRRADVERLAQDASWRLRAPRQPRP